MPSQTAERNCLNSKKSAPENACVFSADEVAFAENDKEKKRFHIVAYSGGVIKNHYWWGNVMFDMDGFKFDKKKTPVLFEHASKDRIGFSTEQKINGKIEIDGVFLDNQMAQEIRGDMEKGFPMQASLYCPPTSVEYVKDGETVTVNGTKMKGPGTVFRKAIIKEVSMAVFGWDSNSKSKAFVGASKREIQFSNIERKVIMDPNETPTFPELTAATFASNYPELSKALVEKATKAGDDQALTRFKEIVEVCGDDHALAATLFAEGKNKTQALSAKNEALTAKIAAMSQSSEQPETPTVKVTPAESEFADEQSQHERGETANVDADGKPKTWDAAVKMTMQKEISDKTQKLMTKVEAIRFCAGQYPELHQAFKIGNTQKAAG